MKGLSAIRRNSGSIRQKTVQQLQVLALIFVITLLAMKIYVQIFPYSFDQGILKKKMSFFNLRFKCKNLLNSFLFLFL